MADQKHTPKPVPPMETTPWDDELSASIGVQFGDAVGEFLTYREQQFLLTTPAAVVPLLDFLKLDEEFDYLVDITAVDYPEKPERFELIYVLYSYARNRRIRVKTRFADGEQPASITAVYPAANWLEREVYDMFGIRFTGHPDLRRILLPDEWEGHPLRKDSSITGMDNRWVQENLGIESGQ